MIVTCRYVGVVLAVVQNVVVRLMSVVYVMLI